MYCVNHPRTETLVSCSACGDPICPDCMVFTAVGAKCHKCAKMPKSALVRLKPERALLAGAIGLGAALLGGAAFMLVISSMGFFAILISFALGYGIGEAVSWGSGRYHATTLAAWAAFCAALAVLLPFIMSGVSLFGVGPTALRYALLAGGLWKFLWLAAACFGAWQRNA